MSKFPQNGFGTVSMLAVAAGLAVLGAGAYWLGMPKYQEYQLQKKVAEVFVSAYSCRAEVNQVVQKASTPQLSRSLFACDGGISAGAKISPYLKSIAVGDAGSITLTLNYLSLLELTPSTNVLTLVPMVDAGTRLGVDDVRKPIAAWRCGSPTDGTTVPSYLLPSDCRG